ncbi:MAG: DUF1854 domain-containing protein [Clostridia bacterium]|jgi:hypothetical protein|nr:DUF1854 domain-containing protein [Clostridia bacterium]
MNKTNQLTIEFLNPAVCSFSYNKNNFLVMTLDGKDKGRVKLIRAYPFSLKEDYICVHDIEDNEIGILLTLTELDEESHKACTKELETRYYCPTVENVKSIKERMGHFYFETIIDGKVKKFTVRDITSNIRYASENTLLIFDMDGNRYIIPDYNAIEEKSKRLLEPYLY